MDYLLSLEWLDPNVVFAAAFSLLAVYLGGLWQRQRDRRKEQADLLNQRTRLAKALHAELTTILNRYEVGIGKVIAEAKKWTDVGTAVLSHGYFSVFDQNTSKLGLFDDEDVEIIIQAYVIGKGHSDTIRTFSQDLERFFQSTLQTTLSGSQEILDEMRQHIDTEMPLMLTTMQEDRKIMLAATFAAKAVLEKYFTLPLPALPRWARK